jgi:DNA polymerase-4
MNPRSPSQAPVPQVRWLFLDLNSYFASCEQQVNPALRGQPVAVVPLMADTTCCIAASYEAKAFGVKTGTLVHEAKRLCPEIRFVEARHALYVAYHHRIVEAVESCLPVASVLSIDEMACELTGSQRELPNALKLAVKVKATVQREVGECLKSSVGLAPNVFLAKLASDMQKPDGLTVLLKEDLPRSLYGLKLQDLIGVGKNMERRLRAHGIDTVEALCGCNKEELRAIWGGINGERFYDWLRGEEPPLPKTQRGSLGHQHVLEPALRSPRGAFAVAQKLLTKAALRLRREGFFAKRLTLQVRFLGETPSWENQCRMEETQDTLFLLHALEELWRSLPKGKPFQVGVTLSNLVPEGQHQLSLFQDPRHDALTKTLDAINEKFGTGTIHFGGVHGQEQAAPTRISFHRIPELDEFFAGS